MPKRQVDRLRNSWRQSQVTTNCWLTIPNTFTAEVAALAGFDSICIDMQHGLIDFAAAVTMIQVVQGHDVPVLVRVPWNEQSVLMRVLDAGADGVIVPMVDDAAEAREVVAACRYPPNGRRSSGPIRAGMLSEGPYFDTADDSVLVLPMIESAEALANLEAILDTPGIAGAYIGPADLSLALGFPPETDSSREEHQTAIRRVISECGKRDLAVGLHTAAPQFAAAAVPWGLNFVTIATDVSSMRIELNRRLDEFGRLTSG